MKASTASPKPDIAAGRLDRQTYARNFADIHGPLSDHQAMVDADRCYFCYDAPCVTACPTSIDIPLFIRQISTGNVGGAADTIFEQNILGGMCARVCPTETLCEEVCVRNQPQDKPVSIGLLQRYATDQAMAAGGQSGQRGAPCGLQVAVVGAGPAGLACAHRLAMLGAEVTIFEAREKSGGLNEFGIAAYKSVDNFAQKETEFVLGIGGIDVRHGQRLGGEITLAALRADFDAVFLGLGAGGVNALGAPGDDLENVVDAVDYITEIRQAQDLATLAIGRKVAVIGGGMTAIDIAVQSKLLGAEEVTVFYRRDQGAMKASAYEQHLAQTRGVTLKFNIMPRALIGDGGTLRAIECEYTASENGALAGTGETFTQAVDMVFRAIGQTVQVGDIEGQDIALEGGRIKINGDRRTSLADVWAGGDCVAGGDDLTVCAVEDGKVAAQAIHAALARTG
ncbi:MAG: NAD(P)-dependent oxidoreductase [Alphaproteobacteria bacterium]